MGYINQITKNLFAVDAILNDAAINVGNKDSQYYRNMGVWMPYYPGNEGFLNMYFGENYGISKRSKYGVSNTYHITRRNDQSKIDINVALFAYPNGHISKIIYSVLRDNFRDEIEYLFTEAGERKEKKISTIYKDGATNRDKIMKTSREVYGKYRVRIDENGNLYFSIWSGTSYGEYKKVESEFITAPKIPFLENDKFVGDVSELIYKEYLEGDSMYVLKDLSRKEQYSLDLDFKQFEEEERFTLGNVSYLFDELSQAIIEDGHEIPSVDPEKGELPMLMFKRQSENKAAEMTPTSKY